MKKSAKQNNVNQTFEILLGLKNCEGKNQKDVFWITNILYLVHKAVCVLREELLSDKGPKFYVSIQNSKKFLQKYTKNKKILSFREIFFAETYLQIVFLAHQSLHSFGRVLFIPEVLKK